MTNGTVLMNPSPASSSPMKRSLRSSAPKDAASKDAILIKEEERIMDEEITSDEEEGEGDTTDVVERAMLNVVIVNSMVENRKSTSALPAKSEGSPKYGLRKRRRPSHTSVGDVEGEEKPSESIFHEAAGTGEDSLCQKETSSEQLMSPPPDNVASRQSDGPMGGVGIKSDTCSNPQAGHAAEGPIGAASEEPDNPQSSSATTRPIGVQSSEPTIPQVASATVGSIKIKPESPTHSAQLQSTGSVPNPLSKPIPPIPISVSSSEGIHAQAVPCPLPADPSDKNEAEPDQRKVNFQENPGSRARGFSIDMDSMLDFADDTSTGAAGSELPANRRDRAFSFECFAFGISADEPIPDEPLPPLDQSAGGRPRGDSIIFDPVSFQDGGIHEQTALISCAADKKTADKSAAVTPGPSILNHPGAPGMQRMTSPSYASPAQVGAGNTLNASNGTPTFSPELLNKDGRIGIYLPEARRARIARFHAKRAKRIWRKRIKYDCRKKLADSRPRIKGRFVKRSDMDDE